MLLLCIIIFFVILFVWTGSKPSPYYLDPQAHQKHRLGIPSELLERIDGAVAARRLPDYDTELYLTKGTARRPLQELAANVTQELLFPDVRPQDWETRHLWFQHPQVKQVQQVVWDQLITRFHREAIAAAAARREYERQRRAEVSQKILF